MSWLYTTACRSQPSSCSIVRSRFLLGKTNGVWKNAEFDPLGFETATYAAVMCWFPLVVAPGIIAIIALYQPTIGYRQKDRQTDVMLVAYEREMPYNCEWESDRKRATEAHRTNRDATDRDLFLLYRYVNRSAQNGCRTCSPPPSDVLNDTFQQVGTGRRQCYYRHARRSA